MKRRKSKVKSESKKPQPKLTSILFAAACAGVLLATLTLFPTSFNPGLPITLGGALAAITAIYRSFAKSGRYFRSNSDIVTALLDWLSLCSVFSVDEYLTRRSLATFVGGTAFLFACQVGIKSRVQWRWMVYTLIGTCSLASLQAWLPALMEARETGTLSPLHGTFNNPDTFSILPLLGLCLVLGLIERAAAVGTVVNLGLAGFLLMTVFATGCRGAMLGFILGGATFVGSLLFYRKNKAEKTQLLVGFPLALTILAIPMLGFKFSFSHKWTRILETNAAEMEGIRFELLRYGWKAVAQNPLFGSGPGTFGLSYQSVRPPNHNFMYINIAHNDFLEMGTEAGVIGLLLWGAMVYFAFTIPFKLVSQTRRPTEAAAVAGAVVALTTYSMFNFIIVQRPVFWAECWLFGLALSFPTSRLETRENVKLRLASSFVLFIAGLWAMSVGYHSLRADSFYVQAERAEDRLDLESARQYYEEAAKWEPPRVIGGLARVRVLEKLRVFQDEDNLDTQIEVLNQLHAASPLSIPVLLRLAEAQQAAGNQEAAREALKTAREITPHKSDVFEAELVFLLANNDLEGAARALQQYTPKHWEQTRDQLERVLFALALEKPEVAKKFTDEWLQQNPGKNGREIVEEAAQRARAGKELAAEKLLRQALVRSQPDDLCGKAELAKVVGGLEGESAELALLTEFLRGAPERLAPCYGDLLSRWSELARAAGESVEVESALREYLKIAPDRTWARARLGEIMAESDREGAAVKLLREGLERKPNDDLLVLSLARVFERQGSVELALNYYREVARLNPKNSEAVAKVRELSKRR